MGIWLLGMAAVAFAAWWFHQKGQVLPLMHRAGLLAAVSGPGASAASGAVAPAASREPAREGEEAHPTRPDSPPTESPPEAEAKAEPDPEPEPEPEPPPEAFVPPAPANITGFPRPVRDVLEAQIALVRHGISSGPIDGVMGSQTGAALEAFQRQCRLELTARLTPETRARLIIDAGPLMPYRVTAEDLARLQPVSSTWLGKSQQSRLDYETILECVAEKHRASQRFLERENGAVDWAHVSAGQVLLVPRVTAPTNTFQAAFLRISLAGRTLEAFDYQDHLLAHFPCSIARSVEKRPVGRLEVVTVIEDPNYTFNPVIYPESAEGRRLGRKLVVPSGPNNPVGVAWIGLSRPGYGIHGTPVPELVGRTESHGCFRLANWDASYLLKLVSRGTPVFVEE
ncbi:MAG: murein L,D-transpeptidase [Verrucomicrobiae bacterium]|nr:murein L,D-transpeptidase [Verrucomicrobiae bacterium]